MANLLRKPSGKHGKVHDITPESANWGYVGFGLYRLKAGETSLRIVFMCLLRATGMQCQQPIACLLSAQHLANRAATHKNSDRKG